MAFLEFGPIICIVSQQTCAKVCNGLGGVVNNEMGKDLLSGDGFIFLNKRRTLIKVLVWDRTGYVIYYKKLASGTLELRIGKKTSRHSNWRYRPY
ncbi:MAG: IS66 family insertion sequence element accessory protein TnpB [Saprospiraceae bacterium]|nr:IS66 family insertion sequence element accessory protein TnpB [Saprospiraceae bacterium]